MEPPKPCQKAVLAQYEVKDINLCQGFYWLENAREKDQVCLIYVKSGRLNLQGCNFQMEQVCCQVGQKAPCIY